MGDAGDTEPPGPPGIERGSDSSVANADSRTRVAELMEPAEAYVPPESRQEWYAPEYAPATYVMRAWNRARRGAIRIRAFAFP